MARGNAFRRQADEAVRRSAGLLRALFQRRRKSPAPNHPNRNAGDDGQSLVEFAVTLPVLFALIFCFMEMCLAFYTHSMMSEAAREGTRYAMFRGASCKTSSNTSCTVTSTQVNSYVSGLGWPNIAGGTMTPAASYPDGNQAVGSHVQVKVTYVFKITIPFVPKNSISMSSTSKVVIVQ